MATKQATGDGSIDDLMAQLETIRADVAKLTSILSKIATDEVDTARGKVRDAASASASPGLPATARSRRLTKWKPRSSATP